MDWGFVQVDTNTDASYKVACFAMICHHCGERYIEFFPNARQENLFIGMIHAFTYMGIPRYILTDNLSCKALLYITGCLEQDTSEQPHSIPARGQRR